MKNKLKVLDLFSGIGGFSLGLENTDYYETVAFCEIEKFQQQVLKKNWPKVPIYSDIKELSYERLKADGINTIDVVTGGYPCQPFSIAGKQKGEQDPRHLWPEMFRIIKECRPSWVIGENVSGHIKFGLDTVLDNLESEGYSARTFNISASSIGAWHKRERVWIVASNSNSERKYSRNASKKGTTNARELQGGKRRNTRTMEVWDVEPKLGRVAHGIPNKPHRIRALGNSVVPQIPQLIGISIIEVVQSFNNTE